MTGFSLDFIHIVHAARRANAAQRMLLARLACLGRLAPDLIRSETPEWIDLWAWSFLAAPKRRQAGLFLLAIGFDHEGAV